jgi:hypothetical protein
VEDPLYLEQVLSFPLNLLEEVDDASWSPSRPAWNTKCSPSYRANSSAT